MYFNFIFTILCSPVLLKIIWFESWVNKLMGWNLLNSSLITFCIRKPVWSKLSINCSSFVTKDRKCFMFVVGNYTLYNTFAQYCWLSHTHSFWGKAVFFSQNEWKILIRYLGYIFFPISLIRTLYLTSVYLVKIKFLYI